MLAMIIRHQTSGEDEEITKNIYVDGVLQTSDNRKDLMTESIRLKELFAEGNLTSDNTISITRR